MGSTLKEQESTREFVNGETAVGCCPVLGLSASLEVLSSPRDGALDEVWILLVLRSVAGKISVMIGACAESPSFMRVPFLRSVPVCMCAAEVHVVPKQSLMLLAVVAIVICRWGEYLATYEM